MSTPTLRLAIVVVNFHSHALLAENLTRVQEEGEAATIVVVDNSCDSGESQQLRRLAQEHEWLLVTLPDNRGFGGGMNAGVQAATSAGADHFLLLNPDATIDATSIRLLRRRLQDHDRSLVAPRILESSGRVWFDGVDVYLADGHMRPTRRRGEHAGAQVAPWLSGACLMIGRRLWDELGGFDEEYFLYWEDVDLSFRATHLGATLILEPGATAIHDEGGTQDGQHQKSDVYYYYNIRNRLLFAARNLPPDDIRRWLRTTVKESWQILLRGGRRQFLRRVSPWRAAFRGIRDGRRYARTALSRAS